MSCSPQTCNAEGNQHHPENTQVSPRAENKVEKSHLKNRPDEAAARTSCQPRQATRVAHGVVYLAAIRGTPRAPSSAQVTPPRVGRMAGCLQLPLAQAGVSAEAGTAGSQAALAPGGHGCRSGWCPGPPRQGGWRSPAPSWMLGRASAESRVPMGGMQRCGHLPVETADLLRAGGGGGASTPKLRQRGIGCLL